MEKLLKSNQEVQYIFHLAIINKNYRDKRMKFHVKISLYDCGCISLRGSMLGPSALIWHHVIHFSE